MSPIAVFSLTSIDLPLTEITFTQLNPTSSRDDAVAPRGSRQRALQRRPTIHSTRNEINPTNSTLGPKSTQNFPHVGITSFTLLLFGEKASKGEIIPLSITLNTPLAHKMCYRFVQIFSKSTK
ncbi:hypothetical protein ALC60_03292 [Trachymyrmex zeteki]|uniref:Uncharacterized protein n=1 Tax=Mycetomoellerius zeteki TaxID=64791 RepID=A0A151XBS5_9HYME|nr:hypothetical protein ALC60_03292 [Trachymyrmex zeteki]